MPFANPWGLLALGAIPLVLYLHRRSTGARHLVPLVRLWAPAASAPVTGARRWRPDPILIVRLLIVIGIAVGLARPGWPVRESERHVVVIDASASMRTREAGEPRFHQARAAVERMLSALSPGEPVMVLRAGTPPTVVHDFSEDLRSIRAALPALEGGEARRNLAPALVQAAQRLAGARGTVHVFSDLGDAEKLRRLADRAGLPPGRTKLHTIGGAADNVAIVTLDALPAVGSPLDYEVFTEVANFSRTARAVAVVLDAADGVRERRRLELAAGERRGLIFVTAWSPWIEVRLDGAADALPLDDRASLVLPDGPLAVLYASRGDPFLDAALRAHPRLRVRTIAAEALASEPSAALTEQVAVIDGVRVPPALRLPALVFHAAGPAARDRLVSIVDWQRGHPILRQLDLGETLVPAGTVLPAGPASVLIRSGDGPVARVSEDGGIRRIEVAFSVRRSSLGRMPAFPVVIARALDWLADGGTAPPLSLRAGEIARVRLAGQGVATVRRPDGSTLRVPAEGGRVEIAGTDLVGRYEVALGDRRAAFAVNLLDRDESNVDRASVAAAPPSAHDAERTDARTGWRDIGRWALALALQLLSVEIWLLQKARRRVV